MSAESSRDTWQYARLLADGMRHGANQDYRKAAEACAEAIALKPDKPTAYYNLGVALANSGRHVEAAQRFLEAKERYPEGSETWADATACAFDTLRRPGAAAAKPAWWNDEDLKALSARVLIAAQPGRGPGPPSPRRSRHAGDSAAHIMRAAHVMRATVLSGASDEWEAGPRSAADIKAAAMHWKCAAALEPAPARKAELNESVRQTLALAELQGRRERGPVNKGSAAS